jgi:hypothetical protein
MKLKTILNIARALTNTARERRMIGRIERSNKSRAKRSGAKQIHILIVIVIGKQNISHFISFRLRVREPSRVAWVSENIQIASDTEKVTYQEFC